LLEFIGDEWQDEIPTNNTLIQRLKRRIREGENELGVEDVIFNLYQVDDEDALQYRVFEGAPTILPPKTLETHMTHIRKNTTYIKTA